MLERFNETIKNMNKNNLIENDITQSIKYFEVEDSQKETLNF